MSLLENLPESLKELLEHPVAVFGFGSTGQAVVELLRRMKVSSIVYDERVGGAEQVRYRFDETDAEKHHLVIHSPAFGAKHPWITLAENKGCRVLGEIDFAQKVRRGPTIVVTGTNGKTTLQEFITFCLKRNGISAVATGQNHYPLSRLAVHPELDGVTAVCELAHPYALLVRDFRFDTLFWTNFHEDHLEADAERIRLFSGILDLLEQSRQASVYCGDPVLEFSRQCECALPSGTKAVKHADFPDWDLPTSSAFATRIHRPALALFRKYWLESGYSDSLLKSAAENFEVRAHRLHELTRIGELVFWNDSNASNFAATEAAIRNFNEPVVWIGGGRHRGGDLKRFIGHLRQGLKGAVVYGEAGPELARLLKGVGIPVECADNLRTAVSLAAQIAGRSGQVVFSPGFPAGELFDDAMERGMCYENAVLGLKHQSGSV